MMMTTAELFAKLSPTDFALVHEDMRLYGNGYMRVCGDTVSRVDPLTVSLDDADGLVLVGGTPPLSFPIGSRDPDDL